MFCWVRVSMYTYNHLKCGASPPASPNIFCWSSPVDNWSCSLAQATIPSRVACYMLLWLPSIYIAFREFQIIPAEELIELIYFFFGWRKTTNQMFSWFAFRWKGQLSDRWLGIMGCAASLSAKCAAEKMTPGVSGAHEKDIHGLCLTMYTYR